MIEAMYSYLFIKGDEYNLLSEYLEYLEQRYDVLKELWFNIASTKLRDAYLLELESRGQDATTLYRVLYQWKSTSTDGSADKIIQKGKDILTEAI